jgi:NAD-dependent deacetylase
MKTMNQTEQAIALIRKAKNIVALTGAGISTEAGIPDFRGPGGMWEDAEVMERLTASGFHRDPAAFYQASKNLNSTIARAQPTLAHQLLVRLEQLGKMTAVVTQNIDGLHRAAGSSIVYELHGTYRTGHCTKCRMSYEMKEFYSAIESDRLQVPLCSTCAAPIKPDIVLFEELLPVDAWEGAVAAIENSDLMLVLGSSLVVYPAADLPMMAVKRGAQLIIVNLEPTDYDRLATVAIRGRLGDFSRQALDAFK